MVKNAEVEEFLKGMVGLDFPTSRSAIINRVRDQGGLDGEVISVAHQLEDRTYESLDDVGAEIRRIYAEGRGVLEGAGPAAPSGLSDREKGLVETMADPRRGEPK